MEEQEHDFPEILEVENGIRCCRIGFSSMEDAFIFSKQHDPPEDISPPKNVFEYWESEKGDIECLPSQITEGDDFGGDSLVVSHVGSIGTRYGEPKPFCVTLQVNDFLL
jgi:hypothetical protein